MLVGTAAAQETGGSEAAGALNLTSELWQIDDAVPIATGQVDLRMTFGWVTAGFPANLGDSDDDYVFQPSLRWGTCNNVEVFAEVPIWLGDSGDVGALDEGNADTTVGFTWRMAEPEGDWPAMALRASARIPTGDNSNGVDGELRLILTNDYEADVRSHVNGFVQSINGDNDQGLRDFNWGVALGMDGPLCGDGAVRWVWDYMIRGGLHNGTSAMNILELGWEWDMAEAQNLGMSVQIGLDHTDDTPNFGAMVTYSHSLTF
jgi:hypothetical protein